MLRRTFFAALPAGFAALPAGVALGAARSGGMFLALNNSLTGAQPGSGNGPPRIMDYADFLRLAAATGYAGADVTLNNAMKMDAEAVHKLYRELNLKPGLASLIPALFPRDEAVFQANFKRLGECVQFLKTVGCDTMYAVIPPSSDTPKAELRKVFQGRLQAVSELLQPAKIRLGLKFVGLVSARKRQPYEFIWRMDETLAFTKECGESIGVMLDSWHWYLAGATPADIVDAGKARIVSVHVSDVRKQNLDDVKDDQRVLPGEGIMNLAGFFGALKRIGYDGAVGPEPLGRFTRAQWDGEAARLALDATRRVMRDAGIEA